MTKERVIQILDAEIKRHLALAKSADGLKMYTAFMEVAQALTMAKFFTEAQILTDREEPTP